MRRDKIPLTAARAFEATARHLNMHRAAEELFVTSGAISQQILHFEQSLGVVLFVRRNKRLSLTAEGKRLSERLTSSFDQIEQAIREAQDSVAPRRLRLRMTPTLAIRWLVPRLADFSGRHPEIEVDVSTISTLEDFHLDGFDFMIRLGNGTWPGEDALLLFPDSLQPVCTPALAERLKTPADLAGVTLLHSMMRKESWSMWLEQVGLGADKADVFPVLNLANSALACQAAIDGLGVAMAQTVYVEGDLGNGRLVSPFPQVMRSGDNYYLVNNSFKSDWPKIRLFRNWCASLTANLTSAPSSAFGCRT